MERSSLKINVRSVPTVRPCTSAGPSCRLTTGVHEGGSVLSLPEGGLGGVHKPIPVASRETDGNGAATGLAAMSAPTHHVAGLMLLIVCLLLVCAWLVGEGVFKALSAEAASVPTPSLSPAGLREQHGLAVHFIKVAPDDGTVELRLRIVDGEKARQALVDPEQAPRLITTDTGQTLAGAAQWEEGLDWEEGDVVTVRFLNGAGLVEPRTALNVAFGDRQLGPVPAQ